MMVWLRVRFPALGAFRLTVGGSWMVKLRIALVPLRCPSSLHVTFQRKRPSVKPEYVAFVTVAFGLLMLPGDWSVPFTRTSHVRFRSRLSVAVQLNVTVLTANAVPLGPCGVTAGSCRSVMNARVSLMPTAPTLSVQLMYHPCDPSSIPFTVNVSCAPLVRPMCVLLAARAR